MFISELSSIDYRVQWFFKRVINRPSAVKTRLNTRARNLLIAGPLAECLSLSPISKKPVISSIEVLAPQSRPSAILPTIISMYIYTVNTGISFSKSGTMRLVTLIHVIVKRLKVNPINPYTTPTIIFVPVMLRILAALFHRTPNLVNSTPGFSMFHNYSVPHDVQIRKTVSTSYIKSQLIDIWHKANGK